MTEYQALDLDGIEDLLRQRLSAAKAEGIPIGRGHWGVIASQGSWHRCTRHPTICMIGALILHRPSCGESPQAAAAAMLGRDPAWIRDLLSGFEDWSAADDDDLETPEAFALGRTLGRDLEAGVWGSGRVA